MFVCNISKASCTWRRTVPLIHRLILIYVSSLNLYFSSSSSQILFIFQILRLTFEIIPLTIFQSWFFFYLQHTQYINHILPQQAFLPCNLLCHTLPFTWIRSAVQIIHQFSLSSKGMPCTAARKQSYRLE